MLGNFQCCRGFSIISHPRIDQDYGLQLFRIKTTFHQKFSAGFTLQRSKPKKIIFIMLNDQLNSRITQVANTVKQDNFFYFLLTVSFLLCRLYQFQLIY